MFRLRPLGPYEFDARDVVPPVPATSVELMPADISLATVVDPERNTTPVSNRTGTQPGTAIRREAALSEQVQAHLEAQGHEVGRYQIKIKGTTTWLLTDLYDVTNHVLYELKGNASRESVRMALGQLLDYSRYVESTTFPGRPQLVVVLPSPPADDLAGLLAEQGIQLAYLENGSFTGLPL